MNKAPLDLIDKDIIRLRRSNMRNAAARYEELQKKALGVAQDEEKLQSKSMSK